MTIEEKLKEVLVNLGMGDDQATRVVEKVKGLKATEPMQGRWQHPIEDYPSSIMFGLWFSAQEVALEDIDANCPQAWFRGMFTDAGTEVV